MTSRGVGPQPLRFVLNNNGFECFESRDSESNSWSFKLSLSLLPVSAEVPEAVVEAAATNLAGPVLLSQSVPDPDFDVPDPDVEVVPEAVVEAAAPSNPNPVDSDSEPGSDGPGNFDLESSPRTWSLNVLLFCALVSACSSESDLVFSCFPPLFNLVLQ